MYEDYVGAPINSAEVLTNFYILGNKSIKTRPGTLLDVATNADAQIPSGSNAVGTLISYNNSEKLFVHAATKLYYRNPTAYATLNGPTGNSAFPNASADTYLANTEWNRHLIITTDAFDLPVKVYRDSAGNYQLRTAGLPALASSPTCTGAAGTNAYTYAFLHKYTYTVGDETFIDRGPLTLVQKTSIAAPNVSTVAITLIPTLANGVTKSYDTTNIKIEIYRTINGGVEFYKLDEVTNGTATFNDTFSDATIQNNELIYTTGGVPDNDPPPLSKFCHTVNGFTYYAYLKEGSEIFPNDIVQSQALDPDSVPGSFRDKLEDEITGLSSVQDVPIVGCRKHVYRIDGAFDEVGRGGMTHRRISDHAGCISHESFVQAEGGLFWFGNDGVYYTEGFRCQKVTSHLDRTYKTFVDYLRGKNRKIKGAFNEYTRTLYWTVSSTGRGEGSEICDAIWGIDLQWGVSSEMTSWLWKGGDSFFPTALTVHDGTLYRGDQYGYVLYFDDDTVSDPKIVAGFDPATWFEETIIWRYKSPASNFGTSFVRKTANKILISAKNETNVSIAITAINDDGKFERDLTPIRWRKNFIWGDEDFYWGNPDFSWFYGGTIEVDRRFPAGGLRFNYLQIEITNDYTNIINSDAAGLATVNSTAKTAVLVGAATVDWPSQVVDYYISFESDGFLKEYKVTGRPDDNTIALEDIDGTLPNGNYRWQLKGYRKREIMNLLGYSISWALLTRSHDTFNTGESGDLE